ncbi:hypothetical protein C8R46DRAFT_1036566 [Mycena filopes]|nr:hypothetical protein C8R46DRAFT_1036566 [Mycena filopes]
MAGTSRNNKRKSASAGGAPSGTKKPRGTTGKGKAPDTPAAGPSSAGAGADPAANTASEEKDKESGGRRRNPHGIAPNDVDDAAKPTQRAFQRHIRMAAGLLTADAVLGPADAYIDHYDKRFNDTDNIEGLMRQIISESKKPNKDAQTRAQRLLREAHVIAKGDGDAPGHYGQIAKDIALIPAEHISFFFAAVGDRRYKEAKAKGYRKPILRLVKVKAAHSDDERPPGGDARKNRGLHICTKDGRSAIVTDFVRELDGNILKRLERNPNRNMKMPEKRVVTVPPTPSSALSRILPVGVPIDFWDPKFYNEELDLQEKAMYVDTGVAFPLPQFCNDKDARTWAKMPAKEFMVKYGNDVLAQYQVPTPEQIAALGLDDDGSKGDDADDESTDLEDTDKEDEPMEEMPASAEHPRRALHAWGDSCQRQQHPHGSNEPQCTMPRPHTRALQRGRKRRGQALVKRGSVRHVGGIRRVRRAAHDDQDLIQGLGSIDTIVRSTAERREVAGAGGGEAGQYPTRERRAEDSVCAVLQRAAEAQEAAGAGTGKRGSARRMSGVGTIAFARFYNGVQRRRKRRGPGAGKRGSARRVSGVGRVRDAAHDAQHLVGGGNRAEEGLRAVIKWREAAGVGGGEAGQHPTLFQRGAEGQEAAGARGGKAVTRPSQRRKVAAVVEAVAAVVAKQALIRGVRGQRTAGGQAQTIPQQVENLAKYLKDGTLIFHTTVCIKHTVVIDGTPQHGKKVHPQTRKNHMFGAGPPLKKKRAMSSDEDTASDKEPQGA